MTPDGYYCNTAAVGSYNIPVEYIGTHLVTARARLHANHDVWETRERTTKNKQTSILINEMFINSRSDRVYA